MLNLSTLLESSAQKYPDKNAFIFGDKSFTYAQINAAANQVANAIDKMGLNPGDKVALSCPNLPYFPIVYYGILKSGCSVVPLSVLLKADEIAFHLQNSDAAAYFCFHGTEDLPMAEMGHEGFTRVASCRHFIEIMPNKDMKASANPAKTLEEVTSTQPYTYQTYHTESDDTAVIVYTSGTTGQPKGAELSHSNLLMNAIISKDLFDTSVADTQLIVLPLFHIFAMTVLLNAGVLAGACSVLVPRFEVDPVLALFEKHKVSLFAGVPTMYWGLANYAGNDFNLNQIGQNLRISISGGASLPVQVLEDFERKYQATILEGYGMSEGSPVVTFNVSKERRKAGSIGIPIWGVEVKLVNEKGEEVATGEKGELWYRGHNVMKMYYKNEAATRETLTEGWLHSGDIAIKDEDGFYFIVDRTKDMIIRGGLNVYPREIEEVIIKHPMVSLVAVIGVPDAKMGEEVMAYIVPHEKGAITENEIIEYTKNRLAAYKYPRKVDFLDSLPMSATGKILKKELRKV